MERVKDLQGVFKQGAGFELLESCSKALLQLPHIATPKVTEEDIPLGEARLIADEQPRDIIIAERIPLQNLIEIKNKYRQILMAVKTKPFVLLAGISGIGKSSLVRTLAYKTCNEKELQYPDRPGNFELIKVKPDWYDSSELIGYTTQKAGMIRYNITTFIRFIIKAWRYTQVPFWLCLDEMNLAKVEQYFAEFLSIIETVRFHEGQMYSDAFISRDDILLYSNEDPSFWLNLGLENEAALQQQFLSLGITMPPNLIVMGTVNMDETTHSFSRKVLDRAMTIEMNKIDLNKGLGLAENDWEYPDVYISAEDLLGRPQDVNTVYNDNPEIGRKVIKELEEINDELIDSPFSFAYRVRNEMLIYCVYNAVLQPPKTTPRKWLLTCMDEMIMMKILSRIEGNEKKCGGIINGLLEKTGARFPESHKKLLQMQIRLNNNGYTSFWN
jgi:energy-coupling factor transporter ATP-binding protein EcfA2